MKDEEIVRKQAIELHLKSIPANIIVDTLGKTRQWVHKWIKRYKTGRTAKKSRGSQWAK